MKEPFPYCNMKNASWEHLSALSGSETDIKMCVSPAPSGWWQWQAKWLDYLPFRVNPQNLSSCLRLFGKQFALADKHIHETRRKKVFFCLFFLQKEKVNREECDEKEPCYHADQSHFLRSTDFQVLLQLFKGPLGTVSLVLEEIRPRCTGITSMIHPSLARDMHIIKKPENSVEKKHLYVSLIM